jgi:hypothetical protein
MFEIYMFVAMFALQILILSVLHPSRLIRRVRMQVASYPPEQFPQLYTAGQTEIERWLAKYRLKNLIIAVLGLLLLGGLFRYMRQPGWDDEGVGVLLTVYFMVQMFPIIRFVWDIGRDDERLRNLLADGKRKAVLQRRGLFDFVSPFIVFLTVLCYPLFIALVIFLPGFAGYPIIAIVSLPYGLTAFGVYWILYRTKSNPLLSHESRMRYIGGLVKLCVYICLATVVFLSLAFTMEMLDLENVKPFVLSVFFVTIALIFLMGLNEPPNKLEVDGLNSSVVS